MEKKLRDCLLFAVAGLLIGFAMGYGLLPKEPGILSEGQIRQIIMERPGSMHLEVKPETVEFVNLSLEFREGRRVWVVDYECEGRPIPLPGMSIQQFTRMSIRVVRDAYTGGLMYSGSVDLEPGIWDGRVEFYQEVGSVAMWGDMEGFGNTMWSMIPATFPQAFKMSTVITHGDGRESIARHTHRFRAQLNPETTILFFISATEPIYFKVVLLVGREAGGDFVYRTILEVPNITSHHDTFQVREGGVYKFVFERVQVKPVATVTFTALDVSSSPLPIFGE